MQKTKDNETFDEKTTKKNEMQEMQKIQTKRKTMAKNSNTKVLYYKKKKTIKQTPKKQKIETSSSKKSKTKKLFECKAMLNNRQCKIINYYNYYKKPSQKTKCIFSLEQ